MQLVLFFQLQKGIFVSLLGWGRNYLVIVIFYSESSSFNKLRKFQLSFCKLAFALMTRLV